MVTLRAHAHETTGYRCNQRGRRPPGVQRSARSQSLSPFICKQACVSFISIAPQWKRMLTWPLSRLQVTLVLLPFNIIYPLTKRWTWWPQIWLGAPHDLNDCPLVLFRFSQDLRARLGRR